MPQQRLCMNEVPAELQSRVLTDATGLPRYWPMVWEALHGASLSDTTLGKHLRAIDRLYKSASEQLGADQLDRLLMHQNFDSLAGILEGFLLTLRSEASRSSVDAEAEWKMGFGFVRDTIERQLRNDGFEARLTLIHQSLEHLRRLEASLCPRGQPKQPIVRALPASVVEDLYAIAEPTSRRNPFRGDAIRWRNYAVFLLLLHLGLRRGEVLTLPLDALKTEYDLNLGKDCHWINVIENQYEVDPRHSPARVKNSHSRRQIPVSYDVLEVINYYVESIRGRQEHSFLFSSSRRLPLALPSLNWIVKTLSSVISAGAKSDLRNRLRRETVSPHDFRHTCAVVRLRAFIASGIPMDVALQKLRVFFGWSRTSDMPLLYARAYFEDRLKTVWAERFDERVEMLGNLNALEAGDGFA